MAGSNYRCLDKNIFDRRCPDDGFPSETHYEQALVEDSVMVCYHNFRQQLQLDPTKPELNREQHRTFLLRGLEGLSESYKCLDASRPWLCYWILHSLELLGECMSDEIATAVCTFLKCCQNSEGGFGGGPDQFPHLAPTYAAVNALCIIGTEAAYEVIDRAALQRFLLRMHQPDGAFIMHDGGEIDIRGAYCAASVARLTRIHTPEMFDGTPEWIVSCQTYEGGFAGVPGCEAHGGYSFCGLAALVLLGRERLADTKSLLRWTVNRQQSLEGGFSGRTNKLVDGCYSFWQGGAIPLLHMTLSSHNESSSKIAERSRWLFHQQALQEYVLLCCQHPHGGLLDKPGKPRDFYHTCYCLSGLSVSQHCMSTANNAPSTQTIGSPNNELVPTHPVYNIGLKAVTKAASYFKQQAVIVPKLVDETLI